MFYVYVFNANAEEFECVGAFSKEDEAHACLEIARSVWDSGTSPRMGMKTFPGTIIQQDWKSFREQLLFSHLGKLAEPILKLAGVDFDESRNPLRIA